MMEASKGEKGRGPREREDKRGRAGAAAALLPSSSSAAHMPFRPAGVPSRGGPIGGAPSGGGRKPVGQPSNPILTFEIFQFRTPLLG